MKKVSLLGSTGSIGVQSLDVIKRHGLSVTAISAKSNWRLLSEQALEFKPKLVCIYDSEYVEPLKDELKGTGITVLSGMDGLCEAACEPESDIVLNSVVGMVGLEPTLAAINAGKNIALANKETLVAGGMLVTEAIKQKGVKLYPVDSEHSAILQSLESGNRSDLHKIILTASGGPFFGKIYAELENMTAKDALKHPNWNMGAKITIDSSTLMNKGFEFLEAMWLFDVKPSQIEIVVHRESVVHSAVEFNDGSIIAQLGVPDMRIPIQYALLYPNRPESNVKRLSLTDYGTLSFLKPDIETFRCLGLCIKAAEIADTTAPAIVNAANEIAVASFLRGEIGFNDIARLAESAFNSIEHKTVNNLSDVLSADKSARDFVSSKIRKD
ncbi:MAG: 1-deoxy-D-xylulose-5-phosphate reductoisomerase [Oscillospiraceae bacterium]|nr:1-deoxy-D-xylulose-5-phosphate reductoisomerase [Oscillospiraceae bacterium]